MSILKPEQLREWNADYIDAVLARLHFNQDVFEISDEEVRRLFSDFNPDLKKEELFYTGMRIRTGLRAQLEVEDINFLKELIKSDFPGKGREGDLAIKRHYGLEWAEFIEAMCEIRLSAILLELQGQDSLEITCDLIRQSITAILLENNLEPPKEWLLRFDPQMLQKMRHDAEANRLRLGKGVFGDNQKNQAEARALAVRHKNPESLATTYLGYDLLDD